MAVAQFANHVGHHLKQLSFSHFRIYLAGVALMHLIPVDTFF